MFPTYSANCFFELHIKSFHEITKQNVMQKQAPKLQSFMQTIEIKNLIYNLSKLLKFSPNWAFWGKKPLFLLILRFVLQAYCETKNRYL